MVRRWIDNRCFKMCGLPEANVVGYIADFVAIAGMYSEHWHRYAKFSGMETMSMSQRLKDDHQQREGNDRWTHIMHGDIDRWFVCVFEVKVSRTDFLNTFGNRKSGHAKARMLPVGTAHWVVAEKGVCAPDELPDFWGLLIPHGGGLSEKKIPKLNILPDSTIHAMAFDMLWLTMNYRKSYFDQIADMARTFQDVHLAIRSGKSQTELLKLSSKACKACRGFVL